MTQLESAPGQQQLFPQPPAPPTPAKVKDLLKDFAKRPGLDNYANAGDRITLLTTYLWLRQLTPSLPFETFMERFAAVADYNEENRKHPEDAIKAACPRRKDQVPEGGHQWAAGEIVNFTICYVDMIRDAERLNVPIPLSFDQFLSRLGTQFLAGELSDPEPEPEEKPKRRTQQSTAAVVVRPTAAGQRVLYTMAGDGGRQVRGVVQGITQDTERQYVTLIADGGEPFKDVSIEHCQVIEDPLPPGAPSPVTGQPKESLARQSLVIPKSVYPAIQNALLLKAPLANVAISDSLYTYTASFGDEYDVIIDITNGEAGPFVDARLVRLKDDNIICTIPPRKTLEGSYHFDTPAGIYDLEVKVRQ